MPNLLSICIGRHPELGKLTATGEIQVTPCYDAATNYLSHAQGYSNLAVGY